MERITIHIESEEKANLLLSLLKSVDFIDDVHIESVVQAPVEDFFDLAGIWTDRDIDQESLRKLAYQSASSQTK